MILGIEQFHTKILSVFARPKHGIGIGGYGHFNQIEASLEQSIGWMGVVHVLGSFTPIGAQMRHASPRHGVGTARKAQFGRNGEGGVVRRATAGAKSLWTKS